MIDHPNSSALLSSSTLTTPPCKISINSISQWLAFTYSVGIDTDMDVNVAATNRPRFQLVERQFSQISTTGPMQNCGPVWKTRQGPPRFWMSKCLRRMHGNTAPILRSSHSYNNRRGGTRTQLLCRVRLEETRRDTPCSAQGGGGTCALLRCAQLYLRWASSHCAETPSTAEGNLLSRTTWPNPNQ